MNRLYKALIKKDLLFSIKLLPVSVACAVAIPVYCGAFAHNLLATPLVAMSTALIFAVLAYLSAICYLEDNPETEGFLRAMPLAKRTKVFARYGATGILIIAALVVAAVSFVAAGGRLEVGDVTGAASITTVLYGAFLYVFYKAGLQTAQYVPATLILAGAVAVKTGALAELAILAEYEYAALPVAAVVFVMAAKFSAEE